MPAKEVPSFSRLAFPTLKGVHTTQNKLKRLYEAEGSSAQLSPEAQRIIILTIYLWSSVDTHVLASAYVFLSCAELFYKHYSLCSGQSVFGGESPIGVSKRGYNGFSSRAVIAPLCEEERAYLTIFSLPFSCFFSRLLPSTLHSSIFPPRLRAC